MSKTELIQLDSLGKQINEMHNLAVQSGNTAINHSLECGELLNEARNQCKINKISFSDWIYDNCKFERRQAYSYLKVFESKKLIVQRAAQSDVSIRGALSFLSDIKKAERKDELNRQQDDINAGRIVLPDGVFEVIVIDPPWPYGTKYDPKGRRIANPYPEMSLEEIQDIELPMADDCVLWLWTTHKFMRHSFGILDTWKFKDVAILTWVKNKIGMGNWLRSQSEFCVMAVYGKPQVNLANQTTVLNGQARQHSRKPEEFYALVESLCIGRRLDYFSREKREGWEQLGNQPEKFK